MCKGMRREKRSLGGGGTGIEWRCRVQECEWKDPELSSLWFLTLLSLKFMVSDTSGCSRNSP